MLIVRKGNAVDALEAGDINVLAHGVNCAGGFGSGIAGELARRFPLAKEGYMNNYTSGRWKLGHIQEVSIKNPVSCVILNCATQLNYGRDGRKYTDEAKVADVLSRAAEYCRTRDRKLGFPFIGAGLGGADKDAVFLEMINIFNSKLYQDLDAYLYILDAKDYAKYSNQANDFEHIENTYNDIYQNIH